MKKSTASAKPPQTAHNAQEPETASKASVLGSYEGRLALITVASSMTWFVWNFYQTWSDTKTPADLQGFVSVFLPLILLVLVYLVGYVILLGLSIFLEPPNGKRKDGSLLEHLISVAPSLILGTFVAIVGLSLMLFSILSLSPNWLGLLVWGLATLAVILYNKFSALKKNWFNVVKWSLLIVSFILVLFVAVNEVCFFTSGFNIETDKTVYSANEQVFIKAYPYGIIKPHLKEIIYSNKNITLVDRTNDQFILSPTYAIINSTNLTFEPYNSYIIVVYSYGTAAAFNIGLPIETQRIIFVPTFNQNASATMVVNNTTIINYFVNESNSTSH